MKLFRNKKQQYKLLL